MARAPRLDRIRTLRDECSPMHPAAFFRELNAALPSDVLYSWDGGAAALWRSPAMAA